MIPILSRKNMIAGWLSLRGRTRGIRLKSFLILLAVGLIMFPAGPSLASDLSLESVGIRGGFNNSDVNLLRAQFDDAENEFENFQQYDVFVVLNLPWHWYFPSRDCDLPETQDCSLDAEWEVRVLANGSAGFLTGGGETGLITTFGPGLTVRKPSWRLAVDVGGGVALLSDYLYGRQDLGGPLQFVGEVGISMDLGWNLIGGLRFHHMSDASIYGNKNRGIDLYMFELSYRFRMPFLP